MFEDTVLQVVDSKVYHGLLMYVRIVLFIAIYFLNCQRHGLSAEWSKLFVDSLVSFCLLTCAECFRSLLYSVTTAEIAANAKCDQI